MRLLDTRPIRGFWLSMNMLFLVPALLGFSIQSTPIPSESQIAAFKAAYAARLTDTPGQKPDPAISKDLDLLIDSVKEGLKRSPNLSDKIVDQVLHAFAQSIHVDESSFVPTDEYPSFYVEVSAFDGLHFLVARMGAVTRSAAFDSEWRSIRLPATFYWNAPWNPRFQKLPCGLVFVEEVTIQAASSRVGIQYIWLKSTGKDLVQVGHYRGHTILDNLPTEVKGDRVSIQTADPVHSFIDYPSTILFPRENVWVCSIHGPRLVWSQTGNMALRAVDRELYKAWHTKHPSAVQRRIRKVFTPEEFSDVYDLESWSQMTLPRKRVRVTLDHTDWMELQETSSGYRLLKVGQSNRLSP